MPILSDLLISRGIKPSRLDKQKRCDICRRHGPELYEGYQCNERVCGDLWGELSDLHWRSQQTGTKKSRGILGNTPANLLDRFLGKKPR